MKEIVAIGKKQQIYFNKLKNTKKLLKFLARSRI
jgi:hypothetical protein